MLGIGRTCVNASAPVVLSGQHYQLVLGIGRKCVNASSVVLSRGNITNWCWVVEEKVSVPVLLFFLGAALPTGTGYWKEVCQCQCCCSF